MNKTSYGRKDRLLKQKRHDTYLNLSKLSEPTVCQRCKLVFSGGRWTWKEVRQSAHKTLCPACKRIADNYPAGKIKLSGDFYQEHKVEILNLIQNIENQEKSVRPLERIMSNQTFTHETIIKTTGIHIARRIGEALARAYKGDFEFNYADGSDYIEVNWQR
jgi:hypothetical protein